MHWLTFSHFQFRSLRDSCQTSSAKHLASYILEENWEAHGTVQDIAHVADVDGEFTSLLYRLHRYTRSEAGSVAQAMYVLPVSVQVAVVAFYASQSIQTHLPLDQNPPMGSSLLRMLGISYNYAFMNGRRVTPVSRNLRKNTGSSLIATEWRGRRFAGEVMTVFRHRQPEARDAELLVEVRWMVPASHSPLDPNPWTEL